MNILHLPLEFNRWNSAKKFGYPIGIGMIDGFEANSINHLTIPLTYHSDIWLAHIKKLVGDRKFDAIWMEVVHSIIPESILEWLASIAPIRVGFVVESLSIAPNEFKDNQKGTQRRVDNFNAKLPYLTHIVVCDTRDLNKFDIPSMRYSPSISKGLVKPPNCMNDKAIFCGTPYGDRGEWLAQLKDYLVVNPPSAEEQSPFPFMFEQLFTGSYTLYQYPYFFRNWHLSRSSAYRVWINHLHSLPGCAMVNLPHRIEMASGRIIESMAAGKPVLSPFLHNEMDSWFEDRKNIIYYENVDDLIDRIKELRENTDFGRFIATNARENILENYTTELRVKQILEFIQ